MGPRQRLPCPLVRFTSSRKMKRLPTASRDGFEVPRTDRRTFVATATGAGLSAILAGRSRLDAAQTGAAEKVAASGSDVGSLFPFIQSQAVKGEFPLSFL